MTTTPETPPSTDRLLQLLGQNALRISELEAENRRLQAQVSELLRSQNGHPSVEVNNAHVIDSDTVLRSNYDELKKHNARVQQRLDLANAKYVKAKERVFEWKAYASIQKKRLETLRAQTPSTAGSSNRLPQHSDEDSHSVRQELQPAEPGPQDPQPLRLSELSAKQTSTKGTKTTCTTSSQSTVYEPQEEPNPAVYVDDDETPVVVSERRLRRRPISPKRSPRIKQEGVSASTPFVILSDPPHAPESRLIASQMSDLDAKAGVASVDHVDEHKPVTTTSVAAGKCTPKKRRALQEISGNVLKKRKALHEDNEKPHKKPPLRSLPIEELQLTDFRVNPYYSGPAMNFFEPPERDTTRVCLPGCTRAACCGNNYRRAIEIGGVQVTGKTSEEVLEAYFGPKWKDKLEEYPIAKRPEVIKHAHAMSFAMQAGVKHKQPIRPPTPPGFWRTDMPSTQELQAYRDKADELERIRILERHHEATREGGQWLFRDE